MRGRTRAHRNKGSTGRKSGLTEAAANSCRKSQSTSPWEQRARELARVGSSANDNLTKHVATWVRGGKRSLEFHPTAESRDDQQSTDNHLDPFVATSVRRGRRSRGNFRPIVDIQPRWWKSVNLVCPFRPRLTEVFGPHSRRSIERTRHHARSITANIPKQRHITAPPQCIKVSC